MTFSIEDDDGLPQVSHGPERYAGMDYSAPGTSDNGMPDPNAPFALALDEFVAARSEQPAALIGEADDVLLPAAGLLILGGKGGKGKTTLAIDAVFHLASGREWLGFPVPRPLRVLVVENEGPREMFRRKLEAKRKSWPHELPGAIHVHTFDWGGLDLRDRDTRHRLREFVEENQIDLILGDPLDSCGLTGVGSPEDTRDFMALAKEVGLHRDVAFWFLHHPRKDRAEDELEELSGAWGGRPDSVLMLSVPAEGRSRLSMPKVRWSRRGKRPALILGFDGESESFTMIAEEGEERDLVAEIAEHLGEAGGWHTAKEIARPAAKGGVGANVDRVKEALEGAPEQFAARTGDAAREVGRHANATVWGLTRPPESHESPSASQGTLTPGVTSDSSYKESDTPESGPPEPAELTQDSESPLASPEEEAYVEALGIAAHDEEER